MRKCAAPYLEQTGFGTEKVEEHLKRALSRGAHQPSGSRHRPRARAPSTALLSEFRAGEVDILVGTQMIAKGHDFPRVTLVGVISADVGLGLADFRAGRTHLPAVDAGGRSRRPRRAPGEAIVQTLYPEHYSIQRGCRQDYAAFFEKEMSSGAACAIRRPSRW